MVRDLTRLIEARYDLLVVGAGIHGACIAWDAALRGLRVGLVDQGDFGAATSANSLRIVHGGLRSLARGDLRRMRESVRERSTLLRIAPTLVEPLPVVIPAGRGARGPAALAAALSLNDLLSFGRNRRLPPARQLPRGRLLSTAECRRLFPAFPATDGRGGALWYDGRLRQPERLTLAFVRAAVRRGAVAANYCRVDRVVQEGGTVAGVTATDGLGGGSIEIRARRLVVAAGPWTPGLTGEPTTLPFAFALNVEVGRRLAEAAIGVRAASGPAEDPIIGGHRFVFLVPQTHSSLLGTWYAAWPGGDPGPLIRRGAAALLGEFRAACPGLELTEGDVVRCHWGLLPLKAGREGGRPGALADRERVIEHGAAGGPAGMFSVEGVKLTTARGVAEGVVDRVVASLGLQDVPSQSAEVRIDDHSELSNAPLDAEVRQAVREGMAVRLSDLIFRRTSLSLTPAPPRQTVAAAARIAAADLGWSPAREGAEIDEVWRQLQPFGVTVGPGG